MDAAAIKARLQARRKAMNMSATQSDTIKDSNDTVSVTDNDDPNNPLNNTEEDDDDGDTLKRVLEKRRLASQRKLAAPENLGTSEMPTASTTEIVSFI